jgi:HAD superfamily hydrolase (TIGR01509 family)
MQKMSKFKAVLFDLDGLIVDTEPLHFRAFQELVSRRGFRLPEEVLPRWVGYDELTNAQELRDTYGFSEEPETLLEEKWRLYEEIIRREPIQALEGFWEVLEEAGRLGLKRGVVTSSYRPQVEVVLQRLFATNPEAGEYPTYFDGIFCANDVERVKPAPDLYLLAARKLGVKPEECFVLEDSPVGAQAAVSAGMTCVAVISAQVKSEDFRGVLATVSSLHDSLEYLRKSE